MRILLKTICLLLCLGFATESKGQTVEQTIEWLNSKIPSLCISEDFGKTIKFNDELWRIIGVFDTDDGTGKVEKRLKIIFIHNSLD